MDFSNDLDEVDYDLPELPPSPHALEIRMEALRASTAITVARVRSGVTVTSATAEHVICLAKEFADYLRGDA